MSNIKKELDIPCKKDKKCIFSDGHNLSCYEKTEHQYVPIKSKEKKKAEKIKEKEDIIDYTFRSIEEKTDPKPKSKFPVHGISYYANDEEGMRYGWSKCMAYRGGICSEHGQRGKFPSKWYFRGSISTGTELGYERVTGPFQIEKRVFPIPSWEDINKLNEKTKKDN